MRLPRPHVADASGGNVHGGTSEPVAQRKERSGESKPVPYLWPASPVLGVIYGVLLWADMNTATPLGAWWRSAHTHTGGNILGYIYNIIHGVLLSADMNTGGAL